MISSNSIFLSHFSTRTRLERREIEMIEIEIKLYEQKAEGEDKERRKGCEPIYKHRRYWIDKYKVQYSVGKKKGLGSKLIIQ